jgi:hypothetical protein
MSIKWELNEPLPNYLWKESKCQLIIKKIVTTIPLFHHFRGFIPNHNIRVFSFHKAIIINLRIEFTKEIIQPFDTYNPNKEIE